MSGEYNHSPLITHPTRSDRRNRPEHVVVAGGGVVAVDDRSGVEVERAEVVDPAADALAGAASSSGGAAVRFIADDHAGQDRDCRANVNEEATPQAIACVAAVRASAALG